MNAKQQKALEAKNAKIALAQKEAEALANATKAPQVKIVTVTQNGQNYPRENTIGYVIWQVIAKMQASETGLPTGKQLLAVPEIQQYKPLSITATLAHYRKFYGIRGTANLTGPAVTK